MSPKSKPLIIGQVTHDVHSPRGRLVEGLRLIKAGMSMIYDVVGIESGLEGFDIDTADQVAKLLGVKAPPKAPTVKEAAAAPAVHTTPLPRDDDEKPLKKGEREMLAILHGFRPRTMQRRELRLHAVIASRTFTDYMSTLRTRSLIVEDVDGDIALSDEGFRETSGDRMKPRSATELAALWGQELKAGERAMLNVLVSEHPRELARAELQQRAGNIADRTFTDYLSTLSGKELVEKVGRKLRAARELFIGNPKP